MKTNTHWYPYEEEGAYFKLVNGTLLQSAMLADGSRDEESWVHYDFPIEPEEAPKLRAIMDELALKE